MLRIVLDTNILVSGIISKLGPPARILNAWREHRFLLVTSAEILEEVHRVLQYPRIAKKYSLSSSDIQDVSELIEREAVLVENVPKLHIVREDPDDNKFLECAVQAGADFIASGDRHLLELQAFSGIDIVTARKLLERLDLPGQ